MRSVEDKVYEDYSDSGGFSVLKTPVAALGILWCVVSYTVVSNQEDIRLFTAILIGAVVAVALWIWQMNAKKLRWWVTALLSGASALVVVPIVHLLIGGTPSVLLHVVVERGLEAALLVAAGPAAALHLLSYGAGWGTDKHPRG